MTAADTANNLHYPNYSKAGTQKTTGITLPFSESSVPDSPGTLTVPLGDSREGQAGPRLRGLRILELGKF